MEKNEYVIVSPHGDDELIGNYSAIVIKKINPIIIYTSDMDEERKTEILQLPKFIDVKAQLFCKEVPSNLLSPNSILFFPDPINEIHPEHRRCGARGEEFARRGLNVIFYSTNMNVPWIREIEDFKKKRHLLEKVYPSQKSLWKTEFKYLLYEAHQKWIF